MTVGAVDDQGTTQRGDDTIASWSSVGTTQDGFAKPDIAAPGAHIVSTLAPGSDFEALCPQCIVDGSYLQIGGTSMAAPVVAGVAALIAQAHPDWTPDQIKSTLIETARNLDGGVDEVNAAAALAVTEPLVRRERRDHPERPARRQRQHRLGPVELGPLELGPDRGSAGRRLGELELRVHLPGLERRGNGITPFELGQRDLAREVELTRVSWGGGRREAPATVTHGFVVDSVNVSVLAYTPVRRASVLLTGWRN